MFVARSAQLAVGGLAAGLLISGTVALSVIGTSDPTASAVAGRAAAVAHAGPGFVGAGALSGEGTDAVGSADAGASHSTGSGSAARMWAATQTAAATAGAAGTVANRQRAASPQGDVTLPAGGSGSVGLAGPQSGGTDGGVGRGGGGAPEGDGNTGPGGEGGAPPALPGTPALGDDASLHAAGTLVVTVPPTPAVSKRLCLSGEVDRCQTVTVPSMEGTTLTLRYSGNAGAKPPTVTSAPCRGGTGVTVSGITPGTTVTAEVRGIRIAATLGTREFSQTASLCDA